MSLRLWLVRHAQSTWNADHRLQGKSDPPLTALGRRQAQAVAQRLATLPPVAIYTSPLQRALETARAIGRLTGLTPIADARLQEIGVGVASGKRWEELTQRWPHLDRLTQRGELALPYIPGVESLEIFGQRVAQSFAEICRRHEEGDIVIVSHGGVFRAYLAQLMEVRRGYTPVLHFANASLTQVLFVRNGWIDVRFVNDTAHLRNGDG
ncbi:MAG: histidine phosphatase family protein [Anaerolineae bacterium]